jgi:hypothetical protein
MMRALTATATVKPDHTMSIQVPEDIAPGSRIVVVVLDETNPATAPLVIVPHPVGPAHPSDTYRRDDLYR